MTLAMNFLTLIFSLIFGVQILASTAPHGPSHDFFEKRSACEKRDLLWNAIVNTEHETLPPLAKMGPLQLFMMSLQVIQYKRDHFRDFAPKGWTKYLHRRGVIAQVQFLPNESNQLYTGVFNGFDCGLLRLSLTYKPGKRGFAPGLALKVFRNSLPSVNISALYTLKGQGNNYNFMAHPLSNIVPRNYSLPLKLSRKIFSRITGYPEELLVSEMAEYDIEGNSIDEPVSPRQIFFVPNSSIIFDERAHDFREDFLSLPKGTELYTVVAASPARDQFDYSKYTTAQIKEFVEDGVVLGTLVTKSEFKASEFGDTGIFFRHQVRDKEKPKRRRTRRK